MTRILFVDDEINILRGLRRLLRPCAHDWALAFATSGPDALVRLAAEPFDVIVSDMRMPGMDGAQLLEEVRRQHPATVRIILSGYSDRELVLRAIGAAHRYLVKPCAPEALRQVIHSCERAGDVLGQVAVRTMVSGLNCVPSHPVAHAALMEELGAPAPCLARVVAIVERDPGMTAQVLRACNSLLFGLRTEVTSAPMAVTLLGLRTVTSLFLSTRAFSTFDVTTPAGASLTEVCHHSLASSRLARTIALSDPALAHLVDDLTATTLLHDVGKLLLAVNFPLQYDEALRLAAAGGMTSAEAEREVFGTNHGQVGAFLLALWGLPQSIVEAVTSHADLPDRPPEALDFATVVQLADAIDDARRGGPIDRVGRHTPPRCIDLVDRLCNESDSDLASSAA